MPPPPPPAVCSGGAGFQVCSLGTSRVTSLSLESGRGEENGKSPKCKTCHQRPDSAPAPGSLPGWAAQPFRSEISRRHPQVPVGAGQALAHKRKGGRGGWPRASALWLKRRAGARRFAPGATGQRGGSEDPAGVGAELDGGHRAFLRILKKAPLFAGAAPGAREQGRGLT